MIQQQRRDVRETQTPHPYGDSYLRNNWLNHRSEVTVFRYATTEGACAGSIQSDAEQRGAAQPTR